MPKEWYISFHGGEEKASLNNIHVYSTEGKRLRKALNKKSLSNGITLRELRGFGFGPDKNLYVVNAYFEYSEVLKFKGALNKDGQHDFAGVFVKHHANLNPGIDHPFNVAFDSNGDLYVSSQNTNLVARYHGPNSETGRPGTPMPLPEGLDLESDSVAAGARVDGDIEVTVGSHHGLKTDARDAAHLTRLLRLGEITAVTVPEADVEAVRDLVRAREDARADLM